MNIKKIIIGFCLFFLTILQTSMATAKETGKKNIHHYNSEHYSLRSILQNLFPKERIEIQHVKNSVILSGNISSAENANRIEKLVKEYFGKDIQILNFMHIKTTQQVMLRVKIGEVIKTEATKNNMLNEKSDFDFLEKNGIIKKLAEPNLIAMSGEEAKFSSGGEIPLPSIQKDGYMSIDYKQYGLKVAFTPLVLSSNRIRINVEPEIIEILRTENINNNRFPVFSSKKAKTTIELSPGENFMIAGLVKDYHIGKSTQSNELVISVTPYLVNGMQNKDSRLPTDKIYNPTNLESKFVDKMNEKFKTNITTSGNSSEGALFLEGPVGFVTE